MFYEQTSFSCDAGENAPLVARVFMCCSHSREGGATGTSTSTLYVEQSEGPSSLRGAALLQLEAGGIER